MTRRDGVFKKNGAWWIDYRDADGRRHREKAAPTYEVAKLVYRDKITAITKGEIIGTRDERLRVRQFVERIWLPETRTRLNPEWFDRVAGALDTVVLPAFGDIPLARLTRQAIDAWATQRATQVK